MFSFCFPSFVHFFFANGSFFHCFLFILFIVLFSLPYHTFNFLTFRFLTFNVSLLFSPPIFFLSPLVPVLLFLFSFFSLSLPYLKTSNASLISCTDFFYVFFSKPNYSLHLWLSFHLSLISQLSLLTSLLSLLCSPFK